VTCRELADLAFGSEGLRTRASMSSGERQHACKPARVRTDNSPELKQSRNQCHAYRHRVIMNVDHLPGDLTVPSLGRAWCAPAAG
jgi:hypothetical protein